MQTSQVVGLICLFSLLICALGAAEEIVYDQTTLKEPIQDNAISIKNDRENSSIILKVFFVNQEKDVLFGFSVKNLKTGEVNNSVLRKAIMEQDSEMIGSIRETIFRISDAEIRSLDNNSASVSTKTAGLSIYEGAKYPLKLNITYAFCVTLDASGAPSQEYSIVCAERLKGPIVMKFLKDGELAFPRGNE